MRRIRAFRVMAVVMIAMVVLLTFYNNAKAQEDTIYYIPVKGEVTPALSTFIANEMDRAYQD
jgi:membrane-bound ClpP family serine protease